MSDALIKAVISILEDPLNAGRKVAEVAGAIIDKIDEHDKATHKVAVVGQILVDGAERPRIVVLGPFRAQGKLEDQAAWDKAAESHSTSRKEGGMLAFRYPASFSAARGRFLLAPVFGTAAKAWKFFPDEPVVMEEIEEEFRSVRGTDPENLAGPACICGLGEESCPRHPNGREA